MAEAAVTTPPGGRPEVAVQIARGDWDSVEEPEHICRAAAAAVLTECAISKVGEIGILLADDARLRQFNRRFCGIDQPTNVLAFAGDHDGLSLGDIAIAFETVVAEARAQNKTMADHLAHLVVHGTLHLLRHDHASDHEAASMEGLERRALARLGIADPYAPADPYSPDGEGRQ